MISSSMVTEKKEESRGESGKSRVERKNGKKGKETGSATEIFDNSEITPSIEENMQNSTQDKVAQGNVENPDDTTIIKADDKYFDNAIRPNKLDDMIGRENEKKKLKMMIEASKKREEVLDHILFYGPPGLGKTTFAVAIANEIGSNLHITSGPAIQKQGDLATILTNLKKNDVLFIDEIHRLSRGVEEILYPAMEDMKLDIVLGKGISARTVRLGLQPFTLIGATTRIGLISSPMRDRFGLVQRLDYFSDIDLEEILRRGSKIWDIELEPQALSEIAKRARGTARIALRLLRRVRDYQQSFEKGSNINVETTKKGLDLLGVDQLGLEDLDRKILLIMYKHFNGGPVGLSTLAAAVSEDIGTLSDVYEPFLMQCGLIKRTSRGRVLTEKGVEYTLSLVDEVTRFA